MIKKDTKSCRDRSGKISRNTSVKENYLFVSKLCGSMMNCIGLCSPFSEVDFQEKMLSLFIATELVVDFSPCIFLHWEVHCRRTITRVLRDNMQFVQTNLFAQRITVWQATLLVYLETIQRKQEKRTEAHWLVIGNLKLGSSDKKHSQVDATIKAT